jgi:hypothetical protein
MKTFKVEGLGKLFVHFWFLNHSLRWFLVVHPRMFFPTILQLLHFSQLLLPSLIFCLVVTFLSFANLFENHGEKGHPL